jgi:hypothetical protein
MQFICSWVQLPIVQVSCVILFSYSLIVCAIIMFVMTNIWGMCYSSVYEMSTSNILSYVWLQNFQVVLIIKLKSKCVSTFCTVTVFFYSVPKRLPGQDLHVILSYWYGYLYLSACIFKNMNTVWTDKPKIMK